MDMIISALVWVILICIALPVVCIFVFPYVCVVSLLDSDRYMEAMKRRYGVLIEWWFKNVL